MQHTVARAAGDFLQKLCQTTDSLNLGQSTTLPVLLKVWGVLEHMALVQCKGPIISKAVPIHEIFAHYVMSMRVHPRWESKVPFPKLGVF